MISRRWGRPPPPAPAAASGASADGRGDKLELLRADPVLPQGLAHPGLERTDDVDAQVITDGRPE